MVSAGEPATPISLFCSYSHKDEALRNELADHLVPLERAGLIEVWHDREMLPGDTFDAEIARKLESADLVLVLVSPSFIRSEYCYNIEMRKAVERHNSGQARVIPVVLRPCQWQLTPLKDLLAMPTDGRAVTEWPNRDTAFNDVAKAIAKLARTMQRTGSKAADPATVGAKPALGRRNAQGLPTSPLNVFADLAVFRDIDAPWCPEMVALPAGTFLMGSPEDEKGHDSDEGPQHRVTIGCRFAIGRYPVTFAEYDYFCAATNREKPGDSGWGRGRRPVINVSWNDAKAYAEWLAKETGKPYRLPTEAEWEYAVRAGTTTRFAFGDEITERDANFVETIGQTREVGAYPASPWGLHDMHGNVLEWVEDVWHESYEGAPTNGAAWTDREGKESSRTRVLRGGSWYSRPRGCRSANRFRNRPDVRYNYCGFRVARTLD